MADMKFEVGISQLTALTQEADTLTPACLIKRVQGPGTIFLVTFSRSTPPPPN